MPYGMARSTSGPVKKKLGSSTCTGCPRGRHSRPELGNRPSCSFFLVSTLITGSPAAWCCLTCSPEIAELRIPVLVLLAFQGLNVGLHAEALPHQQLAHRRRR